MPPTSPDLLRAATAALLAALPAIAQPDDDDRLNTHPVEQTWAHVRSPDWFQARVAEGFRITEIEVVATIPALRLSAAMVRNDGRYARRWSWGYDLSATDIDRRIRDDGVRPIDIEPYQATVTGPLRFAAVFVDNRGAANKHFAWGYHKASFADVRAEYQAFQGRLVDLERYDYRSSSTRTYYAYVMIENSGDDYLPWNWALNYSAASIDNLMRQWGHRIYDIDPIAPDRYDVLSVEYGRNSVRTYYGVDEATAESYRQQQRMRMVDIERDSSSGQLTVVMIRNGGSVTSYGTNCHPQMVHVALGTPAPGQRLDLYLDSGPLGLTAAVTLLAAQQDSLDLGALGAPGCHLYVRPPVLALPMFAAGSRFFAQLWLPSSSALIGAVAHSQCLAHAPGQNALELLTTNGNTLTIGSPR